MKPSKFARYILRQVRENTAFGDLARYIMDNNPSLFAEPVESWDLFFAKFFTDADSYADDPIDQQMPQDASREKPADRLLAESTTTGIPINVYNTYQRIRRMLTSRSNYRVNRPPFAAYMWRYRRYTGPTAELARSLYDVAPELFMKDFDDWLLYLQANDYPDDAIDQLVLAYRRSQRDPNDPDYSRFVNRRYTDQQDDQSTDQQDDQ